MHNVLSHTMTWATHARIYIYIYIYMNAPTCVTCVYWTKKQCLKANNNTWATCMFVWLELLQWFETHLIYIYPSCAKQCLEPWNDLSQTFTHIHIYMYAPIYIYRYIHLGWWVVGGGGRGGEIMTSISRFWSPNPGFDVFMPFSMSKFRFRCTNIRVAS